MILEYFPLYIAIDILAIPLPSQPQEDSRFWVHDSKGKYSVKEGYKLDLVFLLSRPINRNTHVHSGGKSSGR